MLQQFDILSRLQSRYGDARAFGIDGVAHKATLEAKGITVAVLGTCVIKEKISPASHQYLAEKIIAEGGAVLSEYTPDAFISKANFPMRNRIIAGLSLGTLVTEAPVQSGALITARLALDYNREIFAVPQPLNSERGAGCNELIKLGARLTTTSEDILDTLNIRREESALTQNTLPLLSEKENKIYKEIFQLNNFFSNNIHSLSIHQKILFYHFKFVKLQTNLKILFL